MYLSMFLGGCLFMSLPARFRCAGSLRAVPGNGCGVQAADVSGTLGARTVSFDPARGAGGEIIHDPPGMGVPTGVTFFLEYVVGYTGLPLKGTAGAGAGSGMTPWGKEPSLLTDPDANT